MTIKATTQVELAQQIQARQTVGIFKMFNMPIGIYWRESPGAVTQKNTRILRCGYLAIHETILAQSPENGFPVFAS